MTDAARTSAAILLIASLEKTICPIATDGTLEAQNVLHIIIYEGVGMCHVVNDEIDETDETEDGTEPWYKPAKPISKCEKLYLA